MNGSGSQGRIVLAILAVIGVLSVAAAVWRSLWMTLIMGGPLVMGIVVVAVFLLGVFVGNMR